MQISKLATNLSKYLSVLAVLAATILGLFLGNDLYPMLLDSQAKTPTQLPAEPDNPQPLIVLGTQVPCVPIYTSLPPKCRTFDGSFIQANGTSPYMFKLPERK